MDVTAIQFIWILVRIIMLIILTERYGWQAGILGLLLMIDMK